jgi:hypothetical protein
MKKIFKKTDPSPQLERFLTEARSHLGYKCRPGGLSDFAVRAGYKGSAIPWSGAFIDCVARDSELFLPACVYTPSGLAEFSLSRRVHEKPEAGDIVFYSFPTAEQFGMPHVGIVTDTTEYTHTGMFRAIEAQINSGLPRGSTDKTGVFERTRHRSEVIAFARPNFDLRPGIGPKKQTVAVLIKIRNVRPGRRTSDTETVQLALTDTVDLSNYSAGEFDAATAQAYARWQRQIGLVYPDCTGVPDLSSLKLLGEVTGRFTIELEN